MADWLRLYPYNLIRIIPAEGLLWLLTLSMFVGL